MSRATGRVVVADEDEGEDAVAEHAVAARKQGQPLMTVSLFHFQKDIATGTNDSAGMLDPGIERGMGIGVDVDVGFDFGVEGIAAVPECRKKPARGIDSLAQDRGRTVMVVVVVPGEGVETQESAGENLMPPPRCRSVCFLILQSSTQSQSQPQW
jgi:hypothetical protein